MASLELEEQILAVKEIKSGDDSCQNFMYMLQCIAELY